MTPDAPSPARRAAAGILDVEPGASPEQARTAVLRQLDEARLVPPPHVRAAAAEFGLVPHGPASRAVIDREAEALHSAAVERFADAYWDLAPAERQGRWTELVRGAESFPRLSARLDGLAGGLDVVLPATYGDPIQTRLAEAVIELYPLRPSQRARRRAQLLPRVGDPPTLRAAARALRRDRPALLPIDHGLLERLASGGAAVRPLRTSRPDPRETMEEPVRTSGGSGSAPRWVVILCILGVMGLVRVVSQVARHSSSGKESSSNTVIPLRPPAGKFTGPGPIDPTANPGLTGSQLEILRGLAKRQVLGPVEATRYASNFVTLGRLATIAPAKWNDRPPVPVPPDPSFTPEQQRIQIRLAGTPGLTEAEVRELLIEFVKAGREAAKPADRP